MRDLGVKNEVRGDKRDDVIIDVINEEVMIDSRKSKHEEEMKEKKKDAIAPVLGKPRRRVVTVRAE